MSQLDPLIKMINQIASNNLYQDGYELAASKTASHIQRFWARSMKEKIHAYADHDGEQLSTVAKMALEQLRATAHPQ